MSKEVKERVALQWNNVLPLVRETLCSCAAGARTEAMKDAIAACIVCD